jgi:hypothetical protein
MSQTIECTKKSDQKVKIDREQVCVLPNFSMTDYASQGKTRPYNPVDLQHSTTHQSYYTCLSRSATSEGTLIMQSFHPEVIMGGCSGWLRQEFRDLEILDEITKLVFESELPKEIDGNRRNSIIRLFRIWKGVHYVPETMHPVIKWSDKCVNPLQPKVLDSPWHVVNRKNQPTDQLPHQLETYDIATQFVTAQGSMPLHFKSTETANLKRKSEDDHQNYVKKQKVSHNPNEEINLIIKKRKHQVDPDVLSKRQRLEQSDTTAPPGTQWDGENYSCAYDALFTVLYDIWAYKPKKWKNDFKDSNEYLSALHNGFQKYLRCENTLEMARDQVRTLLHDRDSIAFPLGRAGISVATLAARMLYPTNSIPELHLNCSQCDHTVLITCNRIGRLIHVPSSATGSTAQVLDNHMHYHTEQICSNCNTPLPTRLHFSQAPKILAFDLNDRNVTLSHKVSVMGATRSTTLYLKGLVYHGDFHFTCRIVDFSGNIWFHDGMTMGSTSTYDGKIGHVGQPNLHKCRNKKLCLAIYAKKSL